MNGDEIFALFPTLDEFTKELESHELTLPELITSMASDQDIESSSPGLPNDLEYGARVIVKMNYGWVFGDVPMRGEGNQRKAYLDCHPQYPDGVAVTLDNYEVRHF